MSHEFIRIVQEDPEVPEDIYPQLIKLKSAVIKYAKEGTSKSMFEMFDMVGCTEAYLRGEWGDDES